jgi:hypothetical protein
MKERGLLEVMPALAGLAGVLVGGAITLYSNRSIQDHQFAQQARADLQGARVAATLERYRFATVRSALQVFESSPGGPAPRALPAELDNHALALLLTHLGGREVDAYVRGDHCMLDVTAAHLKPAHAAVYRLFIQRMEHCLDDAVASLTPLSQGTAAG